MIYSQVTFGAYYILNLAWITVGIVLHGQIWCHRGQTRLSGHPSAFVVGVLLHVMLKLILLVITVTHIELYHALYVVREITSWI